METHNYQGTKTTGCVALSGMCSQITGGKTLFLSCESVLHWAYNVVNRPIVKMSAINHMRQVPTWDAQNLLLLELDSYAQHAQAAQIVGMVEVLEDPAERQYIEAKFGRKLSKDDLTSVVFLGRVSLGFGPEKTEVVYNMVRGYFDGSMNHRSIRKALGCRDVYAVIVRQSLYDTLDVIHDNAMNELRQVFEKHGLLRQAVTNY